MSHPRKRYNSNMMEIKMRLGTELANIMEIADFVEHRPADPNKRNYEEFPNGWDIYTVPIKAKGEWYKGTVSVGIDESMRRRLYEVNVKRSTGEGFGSVRLIALPAITEASNESINEAKDDVNTRFSLRIDAASEQLFQKAKDIFGKTYNWNTAGYILPDGTRLDFSGKREGSNGQYREEDHRAILEAYGEDTDMSGTEAMIDFMRRGAVRVSPESGGINLQGVPTREQLQALDTFITKKRGEVTIDIDDENGNTVFSKEYERGTYSRSILSDIPALMEQSRRSSSDTARFHNELYSLKNNADSEANRQRTADSVRGDADLYAQMKMDQDARAALQLLEQLHRQTTQGGEDAPIRKGAFENRLSDIAQNIIDETGTRYSKQRLMKDLRKLYQGMEKESYSAGELLMYGKDVMQRVLENAPGVLAEQDDTTKEIIRTLKNRPFSLSADQKSEIRNTYGSAADYRRKNFGKMKIRQESPKVARLTDVWAEDLAPRQPGTFQEDANPADMPGILDAWLELANEKKFAGEYGRNIGKHATDKALNAMLAFYDVPGALKTKNEVAAELRHRAQSAIDAMREQYNQRYEERINKSKERKAETERRQQLGNIEILDRTGFKP